LLLSTVAGADALRDPTRPPQPRAVRGTVLHESLPAVSAVFIGPERRKAVVDGRLVQAGDLLNEGTIESVSAEGVIWRRRGVAHELPLPRASTNFKRPAVGPARNENGVQ
jgi:hypothetical protein